MRSFRFRLDRVLEWYRKKRRMEESRLAACLDLVRGVESRIALLAAERAAIERELLARAAIPAADFANLGRYRLRANKEELELQVERRRRLTEADEQRARVRRAQQRVKLVEKMRERRLEEYTAAAGRELENLAAEAFLARWSREHEG